MLYYLIKVISYLVRQFLIPNPFANLIKNPGTAEIVNWIFGGILVPLAYFLTGIWYDGDVKFIGSLGFLFNYAILTGLFLMIIKFIIKFIINLYLVAFLFILGYVILCIVESKLFGEKNPF